MTCSQKPRVSRWRGGGIQAHRIPQPSTFPFFLQGKQWLRPPECPCSRDSATGSAVSLSAPAARRGGGVRTCREKGRNKAEVPGPETAWPRPCSHRQECLWGQARMWRESSHPWGSGPAEVWGWVAHSLKDSHTCLCPSVEGTAPRMV